ncbi:unnamed protein product, partial [Discosporangium mesarthrocarpum]
MMRHSPLMKSTQAVVSAVHDGPGKHAERHRLPPPGGGFRVVVLVGVPGSGKSTVASFLAGIGWVVVNQDTLGSREACEAAVKSALASGDRIVVDRCNFDRDQRSTWVRLSFEAGLTRDSCLSLWLDIDTEICKTRVRYRTGHPTLSRGRDAEAVASRLSRLLRPPRETEGFKTVLRVRSETDLMAAISLLVESGQGQGQRRDPDTPPSPAITTSPVSRLASESIPPSPPVPRAVSRSVKGQQPRGRGANQGSRPSPPRGRSKGKTW